jgi:nitroreductase
MPDETASVTELFEIIRTTRSMRRLKPDPVPNELIRKILEAGVCAPSGGNMQRWRFLVVRHPKVKETLGALYKRAWDEQVAHGIGAVNRPLAWINLVISIPLARFLVASGAGLRPPPLRGI